MADYYDLLCVSRDVQEEELRRSYKELCRFYHPDKAGSAERLIQLQEAFSTLIDPLLRAHYDAHGRTNLDLARSLRQTDLQQEASGTANSPVTFSKELQSRKDRHGAAALEVQRDPVKRFARRVELASHLVSAIDTHKIAGSESKLTLRFRTPVFHPLLGLNIWTRRAKDNNSDSGTRSLRYIRATEIGLAHNLDVAFAAAPWRCSFVFAGLVSPNSVIIPVISSSEGAASKSVGVPDGIPGAPLSLLKAGRCEWGIARTIGLRTVLSTGFGMSLAGMPSRKFEVGVQHTCRSGITGQVQCGVERGFNPMTGEIGNTPSGTLELSGEPADNQNLTVTGSVSPYWRLLGIRWRFENVPWSSLVTLKADVSSFDSSCGIVLLSYPFKPFDKRLLQNRRPVILPSLDLPDEDAAVAGVSLHAGLATGVQYSVCWAPVKSEVSVGFTFDRLGTCLDIPIDLAWPLKDTFGNPASFTRGTAVVDPSLAGWLLLSTVAAVPVLVHQAVQRNILGKASKSFLHYFLKYNNKEYTRKLKEESSSASEMAAQAQGILADRLMQAPLATRMREIEEARNGLIIVHAFYGLHEAISAHIAQGPPLSSFAGEHSGTVCGVMVTSSEHSLSIERHLAQGFVEVKDALMSMVRQSCLVISRGPGRQYLPGFVSADTLNAFADRTKCQQACVLFIRYKYGGSEFERFFKDDEPVVIP